MIWKNNLLTALHCCISYNCKKSSASNENLPTMVWIVFWEGITKRFPWWFRAACNVEDLGLILGSRRSLGEGNDNPLMFLPGESHGQRSLVGYSPWGHRELDTTEWLHFTHFTTQRKLKNEEDGHKDDVNDCVIMPEKPARILLRMLVVILVI